MDDEPKRASPCLDSEVFVHGVGHQSVMPTCLPAFGALISVGLPLDVTLDRLAGFGTACIRYPQELV